MICAHQVRTCFKPHFHQICLDHLPADDLHSTAYEENPAQYNLLRASRSGCREHHKVICWLCVALCILSVVPSAGGVRHKHIDVHQVLKDQVHDLPTAPSVVRARWVDNVGNSWCRTCWETMYACCQYGIHRPILSLCPAVVAGPVICPAWCFLLGLLGSGCCRPLLMRLSSLERSTRLATCLPLLAQVTGPLFHASNGPIMCVARPLAQDCFVAGPSPCASTHTSPWAHPQDPSSPFQLRLPLNMHKLHGSTSQPFWPLEPFYKTCHAGGPHLQPPP